jgi:hypothetical protein
VSTQTNQKTRAISGPYKLRRRARRDERRLQKAIKNYNVVTTGRARLAAEPLIFDGVEIPQWARGARVVKLGRFQFIVEVTERAGH